MTKRDQINNISYFDALNVCKKYILKFKVKFETTETEVKKLARNICRSHKKLRLNCYDIKTRNT